jgi:guanidinobutyrase
VVQIGQRAQGYTSADFQWGVDQGFRLFTAEQCWYRPLAPLMDEVRQTMGDGPVYLSFDIDGIDPAWAPGTGTPEVGGLTSIQGLEIVRGCRGLNLVGADLVEVSPPYDQSGNTAQLAANLLYEMLCVLPGVPVR